jgi:LDH2 family malate/lactate/ureidoglycolate dehydrogenase
MDAHDIGDGLYRPDLLTCFAEDVFAALGMRRTDAGLLARHLVWADLRGIASLGLRKIPHTPGACGPAARPPTPSR